MSAAARRIALLLEYDGSRYGGSQRQENAPSIQAELESALEQLTGQTTPAAFAGRTDAGVHARGQVAAFTTTSTHDIGVFVRGTNAWLPQDIAVRRAVEVDEEFDPRRHATGRTYRYLIYNERERSPLWLERAWHVAEPLDIVAMQRAASLLIGERDFAAFTGREGRPTVRRMRRAQAERSGPLVTTELEANAFLRHQVRRTMGSLVLVGTGKLAVEAYGELVTRAGPGSATETAPPQGLYLVRVTYPGLDLEGTDTL
ncbi:MAG: tRNA pseudouridine(38-40) synthase TruA [Dehalococcoidia bacterium]